VTFWCVSGSSDPYLGLTDLDADPGGPKTYVSFFATLICCNNCVFLILDGIEETEREVHCGPYQYFRALQVEYFFISVLDPDPGSGIGCLFDPWIRDPG